MEVHIISLFPWSFYSYFQTSILQKAQEKGLFSYKIHNLADWTTKNTRRVDDKPYGGGAWTIITIEPLTNCIREIFTNFGEMPIIFPSPTGEILNQNHLEIYSKYSKILFICGHYEWVDERIFDIFPIHKISMGNFILSGGEIATMMIIDGIVRLIDGVISKESLKEESFSIALKWKKEYPQYSRPATFEWLNVPEVLLSWNHKKIQDWKNQSLQ